MVKVISGINIEGQPCEFYIDQNMKDNLDEVKHVVTKKGWDYVAIIAGIPGVGKSTFVRTPAKYLCPWFDETYVAFDADHFIEITNKCPEYSSVILDESFQSLNTRVTMSPDFLKIISHLQIIRQKHLFIFLCLPNYFDLAKGVAVYRSQNLFVCYSPEYGERGYFAAYSRDKKKMLYILGSKFMDYNKVPPNFRGRYTKNDKSLILDEKKYEEAKYQHLQQQGEVGGGVAADKDIRNKLICHLKQEHEYEIEKLMELSGLSKRSIFYCIKKGEESLQKIKSKTGN